MPVRYVKIGEARVRDAQADNLVDQLAAEWGRSSRGGPLIIVEADEGRSVIHLYVVWSRFNGIGHQQRSEIIMDAYVLVHPESAPLGTLAMGLTKAEAQQMGIDTRVR